MSSELSFRCASPPVSLQDLEKEIAAEFERHGAPLYRYARASGASESQADDLVQDAFLKYFLTRLAGQTIQHPQAWLFTVIRHGWLEIVRSARHQRETVLDAAATCGQPADDGAWRSLWNLAMHALAPRERQCLEMRRDGLQYDEIAHTLGIRPGTVAALVSRAQVKIRRHFSEVTP